MKPGVRRVAPGSSVAMVEALRKSDLASFPEAGCGGSEVAQRARAGRRATGADPRKQGADPDKRNYADATALLWASSDLEKTRLLLEHGAERRHAAGAKGRSG